MTPIVLPDQLLAGVAWAFAIYTVASLFLDLIERYLPDRGAAPYFRRAIVWGAALLAFAVLIHSLVLYLAGTFVGSPTPPG